FESTVVTVAPDVMPVGCVDQLRADADATSGFSDATFKHVTDAELASYLADVDRLALIGEGGISCDDEQPTRPGQRRDDVLGVASREILQFRTPAHFVEGEHEKGRLHGEGRR